MEDLNNLKNLWQSAKPVELPDAAELQQDIKDFRGTKLRNKVLSVTVAVLIVVLSLAALLLAKNLWLSTQAAILFNVAACIVLAATNLRSMKRFIGFKDFNNLDFLHFLQQTQRNQIRYYKRTEVAGLTLVTASTLLFPYQFITDSLAMAIGIYTVVVGWILVLWFYIRPRSFSKHSKKLSGEIGRFESIIQQAL